MIIAKILISMYVSFVFCVIILNLLFNCTFQDFPQHESTKSRILSSCE